MRGYQQCNIRRLTKFTLERDKGSISFLSTRIVDRNYYFKRVEIGLRRSSNAL